MFFILRIAYLIKLNRQLLLNNNYWLLMVMLLINHPKIQL
jgi:hypothetical protein